MPPLLQFWLPIALAVTLTALAMHEKSKWAIQIGLYIAATIVATAAITWQVAIATIPAGVVGAAPASIFKSWQGGSLSSCVVILDGSRLQEFAPKYNVILTCGSTPASIDRFSDRSISVSAAYRIEPRDITIEVPFSDAMRRSINEFGHKAADVQHIQAPPGQVLLVAVGLWYQAAVVPKEIDPSSIHSLGDVERVGGKLIDSAAGTVLSMPIS